MVKKYTLFNNIKVGNIIADSINLEVGELKQFVPNRNKEVVATAVTDANPGVVTSIAHGFSNGDKLVGYGNVDAAFRGLTWTVANRTDDTFEIEDTTGIGGALTEAKFKKLALDKAGGAREDGIEGITTANPAVLTATGHGKAVGTYLYIQDTKLTAIPDGIYKITATTTNTITVQSVDADGGLNVVNNSAGTALDKDSAAIFQEVNFYSNDEETVVQNNLTVTGTITGAVGGTTPAAVTGTVITANTNFAGNLTGNVTGDITGTVTNGVNDMDTGNATTDGKSTVNKTSKKNMIKYEATIDLNGLKHAGVAGDISGFEGATAAGQVLKLPDNFILEGIEVQTTEAAVGFTAGADVKVVLHTATLAENAAGSGGTAITADHEITSVAGAAQKTAVADANKLDKRFVFLQLNDANASDGTDGTLKLTFYGRDPFNF
jgi:hypothetical protein